MTPTTARLLRLGLVLLLALTLGSVRAASAQDDGVYFSATVQVYNCPAGMTADTLDAIECWLVTEGFDLRIGSMEGIMVPLTLADATFDGSGYTWLFGPHDPGPATPPPDTGPHWSVREETLPDGYTSYIALGDTVELGPSRYSYVFQTTWGAPDIFIAVFNFAPAGNDGGVTTLPSTGIIPANDQSSFELKLVLAALGVSGLALGLRRPTLNRRATPTNPAEAG